MPQCNIITMSQCYEGDKLRRFNSNPGVREGLNAFVVYFLKFLVTKIIIITIRGLRVKVILTSSSFTAYRMFCKYQTVPK